MKFINWETKGNFKDHFTRDSIVVTFVFTCNWIVSLCFLGIKMIINAAILSSNYLFKYWNFYSYLYCYSYLNVCMTYTDSHRLPETNDSICFLPSVHKPGTVRCVSECVYTVVVWWSTGGRLMELGAYLRWSHTLVARRYVINQRYVYTRMEGTVSCKSKRLNGPFINAI